MIRYLGIWLTQVCVGGGCAPIERAERLDPPDQAALEARLAELADRPAQLSPDQLLVTDHLLGKAQYVFGSVGPAPTAMGQTRQGPGFIQWTIDSEVPRFTARYRLRPSAVGWVETHSRLEVEIVDTTGSWQRAEFPGGGLQVTPAAPQPSRCTLRGAAAAGPGPALLQAAVPVSLTLAVDCLDAGQEADVVLVIDRSLSTEDGALALFRAAAETFFDPVDLALARVAVVTYNDRPELREDFTQERDRLRSALADLTATGNTNPRDAVHMARRLLAARRPGALPLIILMYDGHLNVDPSEAVAWARMEGIRVATVCSGDSCAEDLATPPEFDVRLRDATGLAAFWRELTAGLTHRGLDWLVVTHLPNAGLVYDGLLPQPDPPAVLDDGTLQWRRESLLGPGVKIAYRLRARGTGVWPVAERLEVLWRDREGGTGAGTLPIPEVEVRLPPPVGPCTPLLNERSAAPLVAAVGEAFTVTSRLDLVCPPADVPFQVMFVIDHSLSMGFQDRLENARLAVRAFLEQVTSGQWQFGLVAFNDEVTVAVPPTENRSLILDALDGLAPDGQTNVSAAIDRARQLLVDDPLEVPKTMIVLTDGQNTGGPESMVSAADRAKADGVRIVTVCAGGACDPQLATVASAPGFYFSVPDAGDLVALFQQLAAQLLRTLSHFSIEDLVPPPLGVEAGSAAPEPAEVSEQRVRWEFDLMPVGGVTVTHRLVGRTPGRHPVSLNTRVDYDMRATPGVVYMPAPVVEIQGTATDTAPGLPTLPPPLTPSPSATPGGRQYLAYLPAVQR